MLDKNIFNTNKSDYTKPSLFLGEPMGLFDTLNVHYPEIWALYKKLKALDWDELEFDFKTCNIEFKTCSKNIYDMMIRTLAWQWEADSVVTTTIVPVVAPFVSSSELWSAWGRIGDNECLTGDHEVLTQTGWKRIDQINVNDKVAQWEYGTRKISFVKPTDYIVKHYKGEMNHFYGSSNNVSQIVTPGHRMPVIYPYWTNDNQPECKLSKDVLYHGGNGLPTAGYIENSGRCMSPQEKLYIAVQADGSLCSEKYTGVKTGQKHYRFTFSKQRKIDRLHELCELAGWKITELNITNTDDRRTFIVYVPVEEYNPLAKTFDWFKLDDISYEWAMDFLSEIKHWDGNITKTSNIRYMSTNKECVDKVVAIAHMVGYRGHVTNIKERTGVLMPSGHTCDTKKAYQVHITDKPYITGNSIIKSTIDYDGYVYCITVPSSYFLVRHNDAVTVTGNCLHSSTYSEIVKSSFDDPEQIFKDILEVKESFSRLDIIANTMSDTYTISHNLALGMIERDSEEAYEAIFKFVVALYLLERVQFISSFAITFAIAESGLFIPIGKAVQKICQDEFEIHAELDKFVILNELKTERGLTTYNRIKDDIKLMIDEVVESEYKWADYLFSEGRELPGVTADLLKQFVSYSSASVYRTLNVEPKYPIPKTNPLGYMDDWMINDHQASPQEEKTGNYMLGGFVNDLGDDVIDIEL